MDNFSKRHGYRGPQSEIAIREDAPEPVRAFALSTLEGSFGPEKARSLVCAALRKLPDSNNWSAGNMRREVQIEVESCEWFEVYDLLEAIWRNLPDEWTAKDGQTSPELAHDLNGLFEDYGIGWKLEGGKIKARGSEAFEAVVRSAPEELRRAGMSTASDEIHKAIEDLSKRPVADLTGAVQHGMAALECAGKHLCGMTGKQTLDDVVKVRPELFRPPLQEVIPKLWGFASNRGRHLREGEEPKRAEVELVVGIAAIVATYLSRITEPQ